MLRTFRLLSRTRQTKALVATLESQAEIMTHLLNIAPGNTAKKPASFVKREYEFNRLIKMNLFLIFFLRDLQFALNDTLSERNQSKRDFYARHLAIIIIDFFEKYSPMLNMGVRQEINNFPKKKLSPALNETEVAFKKLKAVEEEYLRDIRNAVAAHRNIDPIVQIVQFEKLNADRVCKTAHEVSAICSNLIAFWIILIERELTK